MKSMILAVAALSVAHGARAALPATRENLVTIRDFSTRVATPTYNPNFEKPGTISGLERGIVETTLVGKKPTFKDPPAAALPGGGPSSVTTAADFSEWYSDAVDGAANNAPFTISIVSTLTATVPIGSPGDPGYGFLGTYSFDSDLLPGGQFYPIDGAGSGGGVPSQATGGYYGNEGRLHNYGFTMSYNTSFVYQPGVGLDFKGDDDLWVFVNNRLVLDFGGVHPGVSGGFVLGPGSTDVDGVPLGLVPGMTYDFDLFSAERHTTESRLQFEFTRFEPSTRSVPEGRALIPSLVFAAGAVLLIRRRRCTAAV